jgi:hypothetical protein
VGFFVLFGVAAFKPGMLSRLELLGQVPEGDSKYDDWQRAQTTSWWGKPLDPKAFWKGRVLWNDKSATSDAQRHGRLYPPMPYEDTNRPPYPNDEGIHGGYSTDGPNISYASSSKERAFWDRFDKTHPRPPEQLEAEQEIADVKLSSDIPKIERELYIRLQNAADSFKNNYPPESLTEDAMFWSYVEAKRAEYQRLLNMGDKTNEPVFKVLLNSLTVDRKYVTEPLTPDQIKAANSWKVAYLQRLRREKTDEQYIQGYLRAWGLNAAEVFDQR